MYPPIPASSPDSLRLCNLARPQLYGFSSARKMASVLLRERAAGGNLRLYNKGAAEWVLRRCVGLARPDGSTEPMTPAKLEEMNALVTGMAKRVSCFLRLPADVAQR